MRKYLFILFTLLSITIVKAQEISQSDVPNEVKTYVIQNYPKFKMAEWKYNKKRKVYLANFYVSGKNVILGISEVGELLYSKEDVFTREIPAKTIAYINNEYSNAEVTGGSKEFKNNTTTYNVEITIIGKKGTSLKIIVFDEDGNILKK